jgi:hypothetical protein
MAPQAGLEPATDRLTADSSTTELLWNVSLRQVISYHLIRCPSTTFLKYFYEMFFEMAC